MTNTKQKGNVAEKQVVKILEDKGMFAIQSPRTMKRIFTKKGIMFVSASNDYYNLFDIQAKCPKTKHTYYIQVKSTAPHVSTMKPLIQAFADKYGNNYDVFQIWQKVSRRGFIVHTYTSFIDHSVSYQIQHEWIKTYLNFKGDRVDQFKA